MAPRSVYVSDSSGLMGYEQTEAQAGPRWSEGDVILGSSVPPCARGPVRRGVRTAGDGRRGEGRAPGAGAARGTRRRGPGTARGDRRVRARRGRGGCGGGGRGRNRRVRRCRVLPAAERRRAATVAARAGHPVRVSRFADGSGHARARRPRPRGRARGRDRGAGRITLGAAGGALDRRRRPGGADRDMREARGAHARDTPATRRSRRKERHDHCDPGSRIGRARAVDRPCRRSVAQSRRDPAAPPRAGRGPRRRRPARRVHDPFDRPAAERVGRLRRRLGSRGDRPARRRGAGVGRRDASPHPGRVPVERMPHVPGLLGGVPRRSAPTRPSRRRPARRRHEGRERGEHLRVCARSRRRR